MDLWHGSLSEFVRNAESGSLAGDMAGQFVKLHRYPPNPAELRSWENSLGALADALRSIRRLDLGVAVGVSGPIQSASLARDSARSGAGVALEYHLPLTGKRVDVLLAGHDRTGRASAIVLELKQFTGSASPIPEPSTLSLVLTGLLLLPPSNAIELTRRRCSSCQALHPRAAGVRRRLAAPPPVVA